MEKVVIVIGTNSRGKTEYHSGIFGESKAVTETPRYAMQFDAVREAIQYMRKNHIMGVAIAMAYAIARFKAESKQENEEELCLSLSCNLRMIR